jgi:hypothetical protein
MLQCLYTYVLSVYFKCFSYLHMLQCLYTYVLSVCFKCFSYFRSILQVFYLDVAYVAVVIHVCFKCIF